MILTTYGLHLSLYLSYHWHQILKLCSRLAEGEGRSFYVCCFTRCCSLIGRAPVQDIPFLFHTHFRFSRESNTLSSGRESWKAVIHTSSLPLHRPHSSVCSLSITTEPVCWLPTILYASKLCQTRSKSPGFDARNGNINNDFFLLAILIYPFTSPTT